MKIDERCELLILKCQIEPLDVKRYFNPWLYSQTQIGRAIMHATALPVLNVDLWILRINVNHKKEREYFRGS